MRRRRRMFILEKKKKKRKMAKIGTRCKQPAFFKEGEVTIITKQIKAKVFKNYVFENKVRGNEVLEDNLLTCGETNAGKEKERW